MSRRRSVFLWGGVLVVLVVLVGLVWMFTGQDAQQRPGRGPVAVTVAPVARGTAVERFQGVAQIRAQDRVTVTSEARGRVAEILVEDGARVEQGALLLRLETRDEKAELQAARAQLMEVRAQLARDKRLAAQGHIAEAKLDQTLARVSSAQADLQAAEVALNDRSIKAPFAAQVSLIPVSEGNYVQPGDALFTLVSTGLLEVQVGLPADLAARLEPGSRIEVRPGTEQAATAHLTARDASADPETNLVIVKGAMRVPDGRFKPGETLAANVVIAERPDALFVPEEAILFAGPQRYVYRVGEDRKAQRVIVEIGARQSGKVEILSGLSEGDRVVIEGMQGVRDGQAVRPEAGRSDGQDRSGSTRTSAAKGGGQT